MKLQSSPGMNINLILTSLLQMSMLVPTLTDLTRMDKQHYTISEEVMDSSHTNREHTGPPKFCLINGGQMACEAQLPNYVPKKITSALVRRYRANNITETQFIHPSWQQVTALHIKKDVVSLDDILQIEIHKNGFENLQRLAIFGVHYEGYIHLTNTSFNGLSYLEELDFSRCSRLPSSMIIQALQDNTTLSKLKTIRVAGVNTAHFHTFDLNESFSTMLQRKSIKNLDLSGTNLQFSVQTFHHPLAIQYFNISNTTLTYPRNVMLFKHALKLFRNLKSLDISMIPARYLGLGENTVAQNQFTHTCVIFPKLEHFHGNYIFKKSFQTTNVYIDMSKCPPAHFKHIEFIGNNAVKLNATIIFPKMLHPVTVDLSTNNLQYISPLFLQGVNTLQTLNLSANSIGSMERLPEFAALFSSFTNLFYLYLSQNKLSFIPEDIFHNTTQLRIIDLSDNNLESILFSLQHLHKLQKLLLHHNKIKTLDSNTITELKHLILQQTSTEPNSSVQIYLDGNDFQCSCRTHEFIHFLVSFLQPRTNTQYVCTLDKEQISTDERAIHKSKYLCIRNTVIAGSVAGSLIILVLICLGSVVSWKKVRVWIQKKQVAAFLKDYKNGYIEEKYLAYIIYHVNVEEGLVHENIYQPLLTALQRKVNTDKIVICSNTNIPQNGSIYQVSSELMSDSCVIIYVLSNDSCSYQDAFQDTILEEAISTKTPIMQININEVHTDNLPNELITMLKRSREVAKLTVRENTFEMYPCWDIFSEAVLKWASYFHRCQNKNIQHMRYYQSDEP